LSNRLDDPLHIGGDILVNDDVAQSRERLEPVDDVCREPAVAGQIADSFGVVRSSATRSTRNVIAIRLVNPRLFGQC
jgi:hypothetical protein